MKKLLALAVMAVLVTSLAWFAQPRDFDLLGDGITREVVFVAVETIEPGTDASEALRSGAIDRITLEDAFVPDNAFGDDNPPAGVFVTTAEENTVITYEMLAG